MYFQSGYSWLNLSTTVPALVDASVAVTGRKSQTALSTNREIDPNEKQPNEWVIFQPEQFPHVVCHAVTQMLVVIQQGFKWRGKALFNQAAKQHCHNKVETNCC